MAIQAIFFDDGGVLNDNEVRGKQWRPLIGEYFAPRYGGEKTKWAEANTYAMEFVIDKLKEVINQEKAFPQDKYTELEDEIWTEKMFEYMGITPPSKDLYKNLHNEVDSWVIPQVQSAYPGITEIIKSFSTKFILHTASNGPSTMLDLYLSGMNVRDYFTFLFGTDLVNVMKGMNTTYYEKIFSYAKVKPNNAVIIDDNPNFLKIAQKIGANVIQACQDGQKPEFNYYFTRPDELPEILKKID